MLKIFVVALSAADRTRLIDQIGTFLQPGQAEFEFVPQVSLRSLSVQELVFSAPPDVCVLGADLIQKDLLEVGRIKRRFPQAALIAELNEQLSSLAIIEQLGIYGVEDTFTAQTAALDFIRKLIILSKRKTEAASGRLILIDSAKGGLGSTSLTAALGESLYDLDKRVLLVDLDCETQDLSRFLRVAPFLNENLQALFEQSCPVTSESVQQCYQPVWRGEEDFACMAPVSAEILNADSRKLNNRILVALFEQLDSKFDFILVDTGSLTGSLLTTLYRIADQVLLVTDNDAASVYATAERLKRIRAHLAPAGKVVLLENRSHNHGVHSSVLKTEFTRVAQLTSEEWSPAALPFCRQANRWPGSGKTLFSQGERRIRRALEQICRTVLLSEVADTKAGTLVRLAQKFKAVLVTFRQGLRQKTEARVALTRQGRIAAPPRGLPEQPPAQELLEQTVQTLPLISKAQINANF